MERIARRLVGDYTITATAYDADDVEVTVTAPATFIVSDDEGVEVDSGTAAVNDSEMTATVDNAALTDGIFSITFTYTVSGVAQMTQVFFEVTSALATDDDLTTYGYSSAVATMLERAANRVRGYARQRISRGESGVWVHYPYYLPQRPVVSITSIVTESGYTLTSEDYHLYGAELRTIIREPLFVTYTHGFEPIPPAITEVVCTIASRMYEADSALALGVTSETAGGESISFGGAAYAGVADLTPHEKAVIDRIFPRLPRTAVAM